MFKTISKLHDQPKEVRQHIGLFFAGGITIVIFLLWLATFDAELLSDESSETVVKMSTATPFQTLSISFNSMYKGIRDQFSEINYSLEEVDE